VDRINLTSGGDDYYTQTNNRYVPTSACTPTSGIMFVLAEGIPVFEAGSKNPARHPYLQYPQGMQPEDYITALCQSPWGDDLRKTFTPWFNSDNIPNQTIHVVVKEVLNRVMGKTVIRFFEKGKTIYDIAKQLLDGHPVMVSGDFTHSGHTLVVVGMDYEMGQLQRDDDLSYQEAPIPKNFIVDDPYGNYNTGYTDKRGNDVIIEIDTFKKLWHGFTYFIDKRGV